MIKTTRKPLALHVAAQVAAITAATLGSCAAFAQDRPTIEEVVVTAERREESLQDVSISVTALNEDALALGGINDVSRLELLVPGVNFAFAGNDAKFNVRGANSTQTFADNASIVGAFVDGVYQSRASQQTRGFFDVRSVEFLRGPQGTLYGRNTFAGALNVYTNTPDTEEFSGSIEVGAQRFGRIRGEGVVNVPVSDTFALRLAGVYDNSDGYINNLAGPDIGAQDDTGFRLSALWTPTDRTEVVFRYLRFEEDGNEAGLFGYTFLCRNETPEGLTDAFGSVRNCSNPVRGSGGRGTASNGPGGDPWEISQDYVQPVDLTDETISLTVTHDFDAFTLKSITSVNDYTNDIGFDFDFSPTPNSNGGFFEASESFTQEFVLTSAGDGPLQWTTGLFYSELEDPTSFYIYQQTVRDDSTRPVITTPQGEFTILEGTDIVSDATVLGGFFADNQIIDTEYLGIFGQVEYAISDQFRLVGGLRYNDESKEASCGGSNFTGDTNGDGMVDRVVNVVDGAAGSDPLILPSNARDVFTFNCGASDALGSGALSGADFDGDYQVTTWKLAGEYDLTEDVMVYLTASTGYLSGSANTTTTTDEQESQVVELGFRSILAGGTLQLNGALHVTEYTNLLTQRQRTDPNTGIVITFSDNGGDIEAWGLEFDALWLATENLTLTGTLAYLDSEFGTFGQTNPYQLFRGEVRPFIDQSGEQTPWSPELTIGLTASYRFDLGENGSLTAYGQTYYSDEFNTSNLLATDPSHQQDSFTKTDLRLIWTDTSEKYAVELFIENIEDEAVLARGNNNGDDVVQTSYLYPQNYGATFRMSF
ncbi:MAG: TonB-dependent receptor [Pseudomonadota bacterium]